MQRAGAAIPGKRRHLAEQSGIGRYDVEAAFLLAAPLLELSDSASGACRLAVEVKGGSSPALAGILVRFDGGELVSCTSRLEGGADGWASGGVLEWIRTLSRADGHLEIGGDAKLVREVIDALRAVPAQQ